MLRKIVDRYRTNVGPFGYLGLLIVVISLYGMWSASGGTFLPP